MSRDILWFIIERQGEREETLEKRREERRRQRGKRVREMRGEKTKRAE
jgi:hypothetical protein